MRRERAGESNEYYAKPLLPQPTEALEGTLPSPTIEAISPKVEGTKDNLQIPDDTATDATPLEKVTGEPILTAPQVVDPTDESTKTDSRRPDDAATGTVPPEEEICEPIPTVPAGSEKTEHGIELPDDNWE